MPLIKQRSVFKSPVIQFEKHLQTILPSRVRKVNALPYEREQIATPDDDFLNIDALNQNSEKLVIITHGFEGGSQKHYATSTAKYFFKHGWDVAAWNCRSCNGEINKQKRLYDHGEIDDIDTVYHHLTAKKKYKQVVLVGWSMGGNIVLKFASVLKRPLISHVISISAPLQIGDSLDFLDMPACYMYKQFFLRNLTPKMLHKAEKFPDAINAKDILKPRNWQHQLEMFYCNINGYKNLQELDELASANNYLSDIKIPTLLLQASNDPILTPSCYPKHIAESQKNIFLEIPPNGGHCGFRMRDIAEFSYGEMRALEFINAH